MGWGGGEGGRGVEQARGGEKRRGVEQGRGKEEGRRKVVTYLHMILLTSNLSLRLDMCRPTFKSCGRSWGISFVSGSRPNMTGCIFAMSEREGGREGKRERERIKSGTTCWRKCYQV